MKLYVKLSPHADCPPCLVSQDSVVLQHTHIIGVQKRSLRSWKSIRSTIWSLTTNDWDLAQGGGHTDFPFPSASSLSTVSRRTGIHTHTAVQCMRVEYVDLLISSVPWSCATVCWCSLAL